MSGDRTEERNTGMQWTFPLTGPIELQARITHGSIDVDERDELHEARVVITPRIPESSALERLSVALEGSVLAVRGQRQGGVFDLPLFGRRSQDTVDVRVEVPSGTPVRIATFTATVAVHGRSGSADIAFGTGAAELDRVDGDLRARFGSGTVAASAVSGTVELRSGNGEARLGEVGGAISSGCGNGTLEVTLAHGPVRARAGSGHARVDAALGDVDLVSGSGDLQVGLPKGVSAQIDVTTGTGRFESDLPVETEHRHTGGRPVSLRLKTGSGTVRLVSSAVPSPTPPA
jgi:hypothetical protein